MKAKYRHFFHQNYMKVAYQMVGNTSNLVHVSECKAPFTRRETADISLWFGLSFTQKPCFYHRKPLFLKTPAKVEISENAKLCVVVPMGRNKVLGSLLSILRILIGLHGFILLPTLPPIGLVIMVLDCIFIRVCIIELMSNEVDSVPSTLQQYSGAAALESKTFSR